MKILLTGGAGFIGSNLLKMYVSQGHDVVVVDNFRSGRIENIRDYILHPQVQFVLGDILDLEFMKTLPLDVDIINHHAAQLEITRCIDFPQEDLTSNIIGTTNVFEYAKRCKNLKKVIYVSSAAVYGQARSVLQAETDPIKPHWVYGVSKYTTELLADIYQEYLDIPFIGIRYSIIYGLNEWYGRVLTLFIKNSLTKGKIVVFGDGYEVRDYCNVKDVIEAHALFISKNSPNNNSVYNISSGKPTTIKELAESVSKISGCELLHEDVKEGEFSRILNDGRIKLPGNLDYLCMDYSKIMQDYGWSPQVSFLDGLEEEFNWFKNTKNIDTGLWNKLHY